MNDDERKFERALQSEQDGVRASIEGDTRPRCGGCSELIFQCKCTPEERLAQVLKPLSPPDKLRWLADDMERAQRMAAAGQETPAHHINVWSGTLAAMARGLDQAVARSGGIGPMSPGNRRERRAMQSMRRGR